MILKPRDSLNKARQSLLTFKDSEDMLRKAYIWNKFKPSKWKRNVGIRWER